VTDPALATPLSITTPGETISNIDFSAPPPTFCDSVTEIPQAECEALVALYTSTDGANWIDNTNWLVTTTPSNWYGVTVEEGHVTWHDLSWNQLSGSSPPEIDSLNNLR